jgi:hypothetical protein
MDKIYVVMESNYRLVAVYTDIDKCRAELPNTQLAVWIGAFPNNALAETVPMWDRESFLRNSEHGE